MYYYSVIYPLNVRSCQLMYLCASMCMTSFVSIAEAVQKLFKKKKQGWFPPPCLRAEAGENSLLKKSASIGTPGIVLFRFLIIPFILTINRYHERSPSTYSCYFRQRETKMINHLIARNRIGAITNVLFIFLDFFQNVYCRSRAY